MSDMYPEDVEKAEVGSPEETAAAAAAAFGIPKKDALAAMKPPKDEG